MHRFGCGRLVAPRTVLGEKGESGSRRILSGDQVLLIIVEFSYGPMKRAGTDPIALLNLIYDFGFVCTYMHASSHED